MSAIAVLQYNCTVFLPGKDFNELDLVPFVETTAEANIHWLKQIDFSVCRCLTENGALVLAKLLQCTPSIETVNIRENPIGDLGFYYIARDTCILKESKSGVGESKRGGGGVPKERPSTISPCWHHIRKFDMYRCKLTQEACPHILRILEHGNLNRLDISMNSIGAEGIHWIETMVKAKDLDFQIRWMLSYKVELYGPLAKKKECCLKNKENMVFVDGNFLIEELFNAISHGVGFFLAIVGSFCLCSHASSSRALVACVIYSLSLIALFLFSTLYHSFYHCTNCVNKVFRIFDYSGIWLVIAGTYTPILEIALKRSVFHSVVFLIGIWMSALAGIIGTIFMFTAKTPTKEAWPMTNKFVILGVLAVLAMKPMVDNMSSYSMILLVLGGIFYISGIPFLTSTNPWNHSIWHVFVLLGAGAHYLCILDVVIRDDGEAFEFQPFNLTHVISGIFGGIPEEYLLRLASRWGLLKDI